MFKGLRLRLSLLYLLASAALIIWLGSYIYWSLHNYFQTITDLALKHKMLHEFQLLGAPIPVGLEDADRDWSSQRFGLYRVPILSHLPTTTSQPNDNMQMTDITYDGELASIFVLSLSTEGRVLFNPALASAPIKPDLQALSVALQQGQDLRTVHTPDGIQVRLLTYRFTRNDGPAALQLGRMLNDQNRILGQVFLGIVVVGVFGVIFMGVSSWWLSGRSMVPMQKAMERQQAFIANASHELRAPLTLLRASAEFVLRGLPRDDEDNRELLSDVLHECDHMNCLVEDLLLLSRLDSGRIELSREMISLPEFLAEIKRQVGRVAEERQVNLILEKSDGTVWGDPTHLRQVLLILLDNAMRHTPSGGSIQVQSQTNGKSIEICVRDTGFGIAPEHLPHIFERFYRADSTRSVQRSGSGLGLSIAKALVEAQQGTIVAESEMGKGTCMKLKLLAA